jgi:hypothetical protein
LSDLIRIREDRGVDVDHDLIAFSGGARIDPMMERRLRDERQGVRPLLLHRRDVLRRVRRRAVLLVQRLARRFECPEEQGAHLRCQPPADHHHTVVVVRDMEGAALVLPCTRVRFGLPVHVPPAAHDALDVNGGAGAGNPQELLFRLRRRHAGQGPYLGIRDLSAGEGTGEARQRAEGARHADPLPRSALVEPHPPAQPVRARAKAVAPALPRIELADQVEQAGGGRVEVRGELSDLVTQPFQRRDVFGGGNDVLRLNLHGASPSRPHDSSPGFRGRRGASRRDVVGADLDFFDCEDQVVLAGRRPLSVLVFGRRTGTGGCCSWRSRQAKSADVLRDR